MKVYYETDKDTYYELGLKYYQEEKWELALENLLTVYIVYEMHDKCDKYISDIMLKMHLFGHISIYLKCYISRCNDCEMMYSLAYVFIDIMHVNRKKELSQIDIQKYLELNPMLAEFHLEELLDSVKNRDVEKFTDCTKNIDQKYDMNDDLVFILLRIKTEMQFQALEEEVQKIL